VTANVGIVDRALRIVVGLALIAVALGLYGPAYQTVWGWIGIVPIMTALIGWCPLYAVLGMRTFKTASTQ
jgi:hypothetical protein